MSKRRARRSARPGKPPRIRRCGTMAVHHRLLEQDPTYRLRLLTLEHATLRRMALDGAARVGTVTIPVVVHVVYRTAAENVSDAQVRSGIRALTRDFRAANKDKKRVPTVWSGLVADARIAFELATRDPAGKPTSGITRTRTTRAGFADDDSVKSSATGGANPWSTSRYLNIWVCTLEGGLLGYAQFPQGPAKTDGVVILNTAFGSTGSAASPFDLGRTATHEVGHWLNLHHIWGDAATPSCADGDYVHDTPNQQGPNYGKPAFPHVSCHNGPNGDMFVNYMDYVDDAAMVMFTAQQVVRMRATLDGPRRSIGT